MLNKIVVYDNERKQIGWASENCNRLPRNEASWYVGFSFEKYKVLFEHQLYFASSYIKKFLHFR